MTAEKMDKPGYGVRITACPFCDEPMGYGTGTQTASHLPKCPENPFST